MSEVEARLTAAGIVLPVPVAPVANYVPFVRSGALVHISGQVSVDAAGGVKGTVG
ncbi:MAG: RidA family protein, partial [Phenylobacterium sp.]|nr:RidA family protein [Phenylobacterium sp.]